MRLMLMGIPPEKQMPEIERKMIDAFLAGHRPAKTEQDLGLDTAKKLIRQLDVKDIAAITGLSRNYCYRIKRGDDAMTKKVITKLYQWSLKNERTTI